MAPHEDSSLTQSVLTMELSFQTDSLKGFLLCTVGLGVVYFEYWCFEKDMYFHITSQCLAKLRFVLRYPNLPTDHLRA